MLMGIVIVTMEGIRLRGKCLQILSAILILGRGVIFLKEEWYTAKNSV